MATATKTTITRAEYLQLLGLKLLAKRADEQFRQCEEAAAELLGVEADTPGSHYFGHLTDALGGARPLDDALKLLGITVDPAEEA